MEQNMSFEKIKNFLGLTLVVFGAFQTNALANEKLMNAIYIGNGLASDDIYQNAIQTLNQMNNRGIVFRGETKLECDSDLPPLPVDKPYKASDDFNAKAENLINFETDILNYNQFKAFHCQNVLLLFMSTHIRGTMNEVTSQGKYIHLSLSLGGVVYSDNVSKYSSSKLCNDSLMIIQKLLTGKILSVDASCSGTFYKDHLNSNFNYEWETTLNIKSLNIDVGVGQHLNVEAH